MLRTEFQMHSSTPVAPEVIPLATEQDTQGKFFNQIKRAADQLAFDRNCQLIDSFIQAKWPDTADA
jgi:hypothetical protein